MLTKERFLRQLRMVVNELRLRPEWIQLLAFGVKTIQEAEERAQKSLAWLDEVEKQHKTGPQ